MAADTGKIALLPLRALGERAGKAGRISDELFVDWVTSYEVVLYRMAYVYVRNEHDALEMVSETIYKAYLKRNTLKNPAIFRSWLMKILIRNCLDCIKRQKRMGFFEEPVEEVPAGPSALNTAEQRMMLDEALSRLRPEYKTALLLRYVQEFSVKEAALAMGKGENTVKTLVRRALKELKGMIGEEGFDE
ncbi:MAG: sigma-70 family RNA polymerase sigma factor [Christensenellaceae bacterium]|jgi:RNA polymerase sigma-70 factor (ECF subfamily)|nr:sigma-70 family RNA polymerase sigma factor [Christensenellaceae bacterium]